MLVLIKMDRGFLNIPFSWLFAIIAGATILFLAIYMTVQFMDFEEYQSDTEAAKTFGILLNPLETSFETATSTSIKVPAETRVYNTCDKSGNFGEQGISTSQKKLNRWPEEPALEIYFPNKYIFSNEVVEGKKFFVFSKPFEFPFKVADLMYITPSTDEYCFIRPPDHIEEEIQDLSQENLKVHPSCSDQRIDVCFQSSNCDVVVSYNNKYVKKDGKTMYFETDALMYAAIFSDRTTYDCQIKRLMLRVEQLASLYANKAIFISQTSGCFSNINTDLANLRNQVNKIEKSTDFNDNLINLVKDIKEKNDFNGECKLW